MYYLGKPLGSYDAPAYTADASCKYTTIYYTNTIVPTHSGFILDNAGVGKLIEY